MHVRISIILLSVCAQLLADGAPIFLMQTAQVTTWGGNPSYGGNVYTRKNIFLKPARSLDRAIASEDLTHKQFRVRRILNSLTKPLGISIFDTKKRGSAAWFVKIPSNFITQFFASLNKKATYLLVVANRQNQRLIKYFRTSRRV